MKITKKILKLRERRRQRKQEKEMELYWKNFVKRRENYKCAICHKPVEGRNAAVHHIIPKHACTGQLALLKWDNKNGILLCSHCHHWGPFSAHKNSIFFVEFLKEFHFDMYDYLLQYIQIPKNNIKPMLLIQ